MTLLRTKEAADFLGVDIRTLQNWRTYGLGPPYEKEGRLVLYKRAELMRWKKESICKQCGRPIPLRMREPNF